jgi:diguanylate cyclase (GGDEF)-like protein
MVSDFWHTRFVEAIRGGWTETMEIRDTKLVRIADHIVEARKTTADETCEILARAGITESDLTPSLRQIVRALLGDVEQLRHELNEARMRIGYLERLADEDPLMPIANRRAFLRELARMMSFAQRYGTSASVVYFDINDLKRINDQFSHAAGDAALQQVARALVENVRNTDIVGRLGGDEFGVLLLQTDQSIAEQKAAQLANTIAARPLFWYGQGITLSVAYGVYSFRGSENASDALDAADRAMYEVKRQHAASARLA